MEHIFEKLYTDLQYAQGEIEFTLNGIKKVVESTDIIGNILQDWLPLWFEENNVEYRTLSNTQEFPDYLININGEELMLEVKAWNALNSPAFDLANFESYIQTIEEDSRKLDAYYLILGYIPENGTITIDQLYLKKIWELTGPSRSGPLTVQRKRGVIYNIRPINFPSDNAKPFNNKLDFLTAIQETMSSYQSEKKDMDAWLEHVITDYNEKTSNRKINLN